MAGDVSFGLIYDFRNPERWYRPWPEVFGGIIDQVAWIDSELQVDGVYLAEHHFSSEGAIPAVMATLGAFAAKTERISLGANIIQFPLHHPLRIAEDSLALDLISNGRYRLGLGLGYREVEFEALGVSMRERRSRLEEGVEILRLAFSGEPFSFDGKHWQIPEIHMTPGPLRPGGPEIWIGGLVPAAVERAGRIADGFLGMAPDAIELYMESCEANGLPAERRQACMTYWAIVAEDPEKAIAEVGPHFMYQVNDYIDYGFLGEIPHYEDPQKVVDDGVYLVLDEDAAVQTFGAAIEKGAQEIQFLPLMPGEPIESAAERLQFLSDRVIPRLRKGAG